MRLLLAISCIIMQGCKARRCSGCAETFFFLRSAFLKPQISQKCMSTIFWLKNHKLVKVHHFVEKVHNFTKKVLGTQFCTKHLPVKVSGYGPGL